MTKNEANDLAVRIMQTWRNGPAIPIWEEILDPLHPRQAAVAYERLRMGADNAPSIKQFMLTYNGLTARDEEPGLIKCSGCSGDGFVTSTEIHHELEYSCVKACKHCDRGKRAQETIDKINGQRRGEGA